MKNNYFKDKKITLMGLGLLGRGVGDAKFLAEQGAELIVTDLKTKAELRESLDQLVGFTNISYTLGGHTLEDFRNRDLIIKAPSVPIDSPYIAEARNNGIQIDMSTALFVRLLREQGVEAKIVGVTGTRGKSTVTQLIYDILKTDNRPVHVGGNIKGLSTLSRIGEIQSGDIIVMELDSWQLQGFAEDTMSPDIAVFTNFYGDHMDYYENFNDYFRDKAAIFQFQNAEDTFITLKHTLEVIREFAEKLNIKIQKHPVIANTKDIPSGWEISIPGEHNRENITLAVSVARILDVPEKAIKKAVEGFKGIPGRLEFLREVGGVKYYNDNMSTTPEATIAALEAVGDNKNVVLLLGGTAKVDDMSMIVGILPLHCKAVVLLNETGTDEIKNDIYSLEGIKVTEGNSPREIFELAKNLSNEGDIVLFSPGFASFGRHYINYYDRSKQFVDFVKGL